MHRVRRLTDHGSLQMDSLSAAQNQITVTSRICTRLERDAGRCSRHRCLASVTQLFSGVATFYSMLWCCALGNVNNLTLIIDRHQRRVIVVVGAPELKTVGKDGHMVRPELAARMTRVDMCDTCFRPATGYGHTGTVESPTDFGSTRQEA